jgi:phage head maturation protease
MDDILINFGSAVKALGNGRIGGYLVTFGDETTPDLSEHRDFFTPDKTDYDIEDGAKTTMYFHHGLDEKIGVRKLGKVEVKTDDVGIWAEGVLAIRDNYEREIYKMCEAGKLSWSSGATTHLVRREKVEGKNASRVLNWPISEASLTPNPADYRNTVMAIKSAPADTNAYDTLLIDMPAVFAASAGSPQDLLSVSSDEVLDEAEQNTRRVLSDLSNMPLKSYLQAMRRVCEGMNDRVTFLTEQSASAKSGRPISAANVAALDEICSGMESHVTRMRGMVDSHKNTDTPKSAYPDMDSLYMNFLYASAGM